jgi:hypothetical protein
MSQNSQASTNSANNKDIALLFLTYENIVHRNNPVLKRFLKKTNVYIHPKYPDKITDKYAEKIIPMHVETDWGKDTIVIATLLLLREAYKNNANKWFVLCSEDVFPLKTYEEFVDYLGKQSNSLFSIMNGSGLGAGIFKSQQWWALTRTDVELLMNALNVLKYTGNDGLSFTTHIRKQPLFKDIQKAIPKKAAMDELFFLSAFKKLSSAYVFTDAPICYTKWFDWVSKHPTIFNRLLPSDKSAIDDNSCVFVRKTFPAFTNTVITPKPHGVIMVIGTENKGIADYKPFLSKYKDLCDIYLLVMIDIAEINSEIKKSCVQCYSVVWNQLKDAISKLKATMTSNYKNVVVIPEEITTIEAMCNYMWEKHESKTHKRSYWYNKITGKSVWVEPTVCADIKSKGGTWTMKNRRRKNHTQKKTAKH